MTLEDLIAKYQSNVRNFTVASLKADKEFMGHCRQNEAFRAYVLSERPDMASQRKPKVKFLGLEHKPADKPTEKVIIEPVEKISNTAQIIKDLKEYRKKQGFL
jgi:hypothetical protein